MIVSFDSEADAVGFAEEVNRVFGHACASIMTTPQKKYVVCYAPSATDTSSEDIERLTASGFFSTQVNT